MLFFHNWGDDNWMVIIGQVIRKIIGWYPPIPPKNILDMYKYYISPSSVTIVHNTLLTDSFCIPSKTSAKTSVFKVSFSYYPSDMMAIEHPEILKIFSRD